MELSEKQLLLLDELMYTDLAPGKDGKTLQEVIGEYADSSGTISVEKIKSDIGNGVLKVSGDLYDHPDRVQDVMQQIYNDKSLTSLKIAKTTDEYPGSIRAACLVDQSGDATVAFRGTGGSYQQWSNNFEGYGDISQQSQRDAAEFIKDLPYNNITVTGHSNGGNQAMYATVLCGDKIDRCVSFEGQGGSKEFLETYSSEITSNKSKITNYCADRDFVSPILYSFAGTTKYVRSDSQELGGLAHGGYGILTANEKDGFGTDGYFQDSAFVEQNGIVKSIGVFTKILGVYSDVPVIGPILELTADVCGGIVGMWMENKWNMFNIFDSEIRQKWYKAFQDLINSEVEYIVGNSVGNTIVLIKKGIDSIKNLGQKVYDGFMSFLGLDGKSDGGSGGAGSSGGAVGIVGGVIGSIAGALGGRADRIMVSTDEMKACISAYQAQKARLMNALAICNSATQTLVHSWAGPSFLEMSVRMENTFKNLSQSMDRIEDAIAELEFTISAMEGAESKISSASAALDTGYSPFA